MRTHWRARGHKMFFVPYGYYVEKQEKYAEGGGKVNGCQRRK